VSGSPPRSGQYAPILWILLAAFFGRVTGQVLVAYGHVSFLPPMEQWQSGLLPYPVLLASQAVLLVLLSAIALAFTRGRGRFVRPSAKAATGLTWFGCVYFGSMIVRYVISMWRHPEWRWIGHTIPIVLHCVLATFVLVVADFHRRASTRFSG
jgi:hypothetical protein